MPPSPALTAAIDRAANTRFAELHEPDPGPVELGEAVDAILDALAPPDDPASHRRLVAMALAMARICADTVYGYKPDDPRVAAALEAMAAWRAGQPVAVPRAAELFPWENTGAQALNEAQDVFHQLLRTIDPSEAPEAVGELLDDCFEGYAVRVGRDPQRGLFDWWLREVVPAAWRGEEPTRWYETAPLGWRG
ncbi:MAG: hypothetical protein H6739_19535 [Alphaproteobacteria bacterium]|nr:hypothetical protein [Alphaproteobacteria bacterium]